MGFQGLMLFTGCLNLCRVCGTFNVAIYAPNFRTCDVILVLLAWTVQNWIGIHLVRDRKEMSEKCMSKNKNEV